MVTKGIGGKVFFGDVEIGIISNWSMDTANIHKLKPYSFDYSKTGDMTWMGTFTLHKRNKIEKALGYTHYAKNSRLYRN